MQGVGYLAYLIMFLLRQVKHTTAIKNLIIKLETIVINYAEITYLALLMMIIIGLKKYILQRVNHTKSIWNLKKGLRGNINYKFQ